MTWISKFIKHNIALLLKKNDLSTEQGRADERTKRIILTSGTSIIQKVLSMTIPLITLKITYEYLGAEIYGLWSAVTTFFALFAFSDLGLGNGLQTSLSQAKGKEDLSLCQSLIANTYVVLIIIALICIISFLISFKFIDWANLMNAKDSMARSIAPKVVLVFVLTSIMSIPLAVIGRTQYALQEGYITNLWGIFSSVINLLLVIVIAKCRLGEIALLATSAFIPVVTLFLNTVTYYKFKKKELCPRIKLFNKGKAKALLKIGILFCVLSIYTTIGLSMDTFIVARTCSLEEAASYSILYKISNILSAVISIISTPLWGANGEAIARGDIAWVETNTKKNSRIMCIITLFASVCLVCFSNSFFRLWLGESFSFSKQSLLWMCLMQIALSFISPYFMLLNALGKVKIQIAIFSIYTPLSFFLKYILSKEFGEEVVPMLGSILYCFIVLPSIYVISNKQLKSVYKSK